MRAQEVQTRIAPDGASGAVVTREHSISDPQVIPPPQNARDGGGQVSWEYRQTHIRPLVDLFQTAEACLLADAIDHFQNYGVNYDPSAVADDVRQAISFAHKSGEWHDTVAANPSKYLVPGAW